MTNWPSAKSQRVFAALLRRGWTIKRQTGLTAFYSGLAPQISYLPFMIAKKSARVCWLE
jgi:hypothetical protein